MATRLVGRHREQAWMRALMAAPVTGRGAFALVEGEAGIGKSALLGAMLANPRARGWEVRVAACDELDQRRAFSLIEAALGPGETAALGPDEAPAERFAAGEAGVIQPYVEAGEAFVARAVAAARRGPLVLAFEDLHWADSPSLGVIGRLARRLAEVPILVLATAGRSHARRRWRDSSTRRSRMTGALASRLLAVAVEVRDMLRVAAILGRTFAATDLARVLACPAAQLLGGLRSARAAGLIEEHESGFAFRHELIRASLVDELPPT
ncbi:MAG: ATP-binding protein, partial [Actinomycetota bacterium]|nr:ATP-binding protein [Actinomycetota bacterium]